MDGSETITSQLQVVSHDTCTSISKIECCLLVVWVARVSVRDVHIRERKPVEKRAAIVVDIVQDHTFSLVEADFEVPFLPCDLVALFTEVLDCERGTLWLDYVQWLDVSSESLSFWNVFVWWLDFVWGWLLDGVIDSSG